MSPRDPPATGLSRGAWRAQRSAAKQRGIQFKFTYDQWCDWWRGVLRYDQNAQRGRLRGNLTMCRFNDQGAYEPGNVYAGTHLENAADVPTLKRQHAHLPPPNGYWLQGKTGANHPRSKSIAGFPSITAAANHYGVSRTEIRRRLADGRLIPRLHLPPSTPSKPSDAA